MYGIPSAKYKEGIHAHGFLLVGLSLLINLLSKVKKLEIFFYLLIFSFAINTAPIAGE